MWMRVREVRNGVNTLTHSKKVVRQQHTTTTQETNLPTQPRPPYTWTSPNRQSEVENGPRSTKTKYLKREMFFRTSDNDNKSPKKWKKVWTDKQKVTPIHFLDFPMTTLQKSIVKWYEMSVICVCNQRLHNQPKTTTIFLSVLYP